MNRVFYLSGADGGGRWRHRPDQYGTSLMMTHPDVKEYCHIKGTQEGMTQQGGGAAIQDVMDGYSTVYYMPNDTKARELTTKVFNHWIDTVDEVRAEFQYEKASQKSPGNDLNKKPFIDATLYSYGAGSAANTASITVQRGYIDEPDRIRSNIDGEGGVIGLLSGRFGAIPSGKMSVFGSPTTKYGRIWKYLSSFKHVFECFWPCPYCQHMQTADWGGKDTKHGFKWDIVYEEDGETIDAEATSETAHYICAKESCSERISERQFRDQLSHCEWHSSSGLMFDTREGKGEFKSKESGEWKIVKAPAKVATRKTKDGNCLYSVASWNESARLWLEAINYWYVNDDVDELVRPFVNTRRGTIWIDRSQQEVEPSAVLVHRSKFGDLQNIPNDVDRLGMEVDFQKRFCKFMITGYRKNGQKTDILCFVCRRFEGRTEDPHAEFWSRLSKVATDTYTRKNGTKLRIGRVIADAGHHPETVIKWCSEDPDHRLAVFGRSNTDKGMQRRMFDYDDEKDEEVWKTYTVEGEDYSARAVPINPHKASKQTYGRLTREKGKPGCFLLAETDDFNQDFADEAVADKHSRKKAANGEYFDHYAKINDSDANEAHDLLKYSILVLHVLDKWGAVTPIAANDEDTPTQQPESTLSLDDL